MKLPPAPSLTRLSGIARSGDLAGLQATSPADPDSVDSMQSTTPRASRALLALREPVAPGAPWRTATQAPSPVLIVPEEAGPAVSQIAFDSRDVEPLTHSTYGALIAEQLDRGRPMVLCALRTGAEHRHFYVPEDLSTWLNACARNPLTNAALSLHEVEVWAVLPGAPDQVHFVCTERDYIEKNRLGCLGWMMINAYRHDSPMLRLLARAAGGSLLNPLSVSDPDCTPENLVTAFNIAIDFRMQTTAASLWNLALRVLSHEQTDAMAKAMSRMNSDA